MPVQQQRPAPPKKTATAPRPSGHAVTSSRTKAREEALIEWGRVGSMLCIMRGLYADAGAIAEHGPKFTHELASMGETNEMIAKWLDYAAESGPIMGALSAALPLVLQLAANHKKIDVDKLPPEAGIIKPEILEQRVRAEMELANVRLLGEIKLIRDQAAEAQRQLEGVNL